MFNYKKIKKFYKFYIAIVISILYYMVPLALKPYSLNYTSTNKGIALMAMARECLYKDQPEIADSLLQMVDTLQLNKKGLGLFYLTKGFLNHKKGNHQIAGKGIRKASEVFMNTGSNANKAETELIYAIIMEEAHLISEASKSYFKALEYYKKQPSSNKYFYNLLGLARTSPGKQIFLQEAELFLNQYPSNRNSILFYKTKAICTKDLEKRQLLFSKALKYFKGYHHPYNIRKEINLYISLALNSQLMNHEDSASFYLEKANELVILNQVPHSKLTYYYLIKAYVCSKAHELKAARTAVDSAIVYAEDRPGLLSQAYMQKYGVEALEKNYYKANVALLKYVAFEQEELKNLQENQLSLLTIRYDLQKKETELLAIRTKWLTSSLVLIVLCSGICIGFLLYRKKTNAERTELKLKFDLTSHRLQERIVHGFKTAKESTRLRGTAVRQDLSDGKKEEWIKFLSIFNAHHPLFVKKLEVHYPDLTRTNVKYAICFYAALSNHQITQLLEVTPGAVKKARKKLQYVFKLSSIKDIGQHLQKIDDSPLGRTVKHNELKD